MSLGLSGMFLDHAGTHVNLDNDPWGQHLNFSLRGPQEEQPSKSLKTHPITIFLLLTARFSPPFEISGSSGGL